MAMSSRGSSSMSTKRSTSASTSPHPRSAGSTTQPPSAAAAAAASAGDRLESASQQLLNHPSGFFGHARSTSRDRSEIFLQLQQDQATTLFNTSTPIAIARASNHGAAQTQQPHRSARPGSAQSAGDQGSRPLLSITTTQATRGLNVHAPGAFQTVTSTTNPSIEDSLQQQALLMGDSGQQPFAFDGTGSSIDYTQALAQAQLQQLQHQRQQQQLHQQQQQHQVPQFSLSQQNYDGTMTTLHHALPDGVDLTAAPGHHISRRTSPFEASAGSPLQPAQQRPLTSTTSLLSLQDPYANGLDVPSPYSDTASFQGSEFGDHGSPHPDMFALSRTNSMTSAFRPDMSYLFSHPGSPYVDAFDASANQPPPLPQQSSGDQASFNFLQPQQVSQHNTASGASPQMAQMAFNGMQPFSTTTPVAIPLEQPGSAFGEYTPGISLNPPTPSGHGRLGMPDAQAESAFSFMQTMPVITTTHHALDHSSHDAQQLDHGVSALERALQEQQQKQLEQLRQHHLQQQQTLLGVEEAARRGRSLSDGGMRRYEEGGARDASRGSSRGRSRDAGRRPYGSTGVSPQLSATQLMYAQTAAAAGGGFTPGAAVGAVTSPGLLGVDLRSLSPHGRSGSAGPGGKHPRRQSWSGQRQDGLSPREVSPSGSSVHSFVTNEGNASGAPTPHAKAKNPATFICPVAGCSKAFTRAYNLRSHQRTHTNERPFLCEVCGKAFARQHDRKRHEALHSGVKAHACPGCNKKFARMDALSRHFKSETGKDCIEGREEYARYVDGQASVEQQQMQAEREASYTTQPEELTMDFGDAVFDDDHKR